MPSKAAAAGAAEPNSDVLVLINLIRTAAEFKADTNKMAEICMIAQARNVPRKINTVLAPHGYKWVAGKIEQDGVPKDNDEGGSGGKVVPKTPVKTTKKAAKTPKSKETKAPITKKKRKIAVAKEESEGEDADMVKDEEDDVVESASKDEDGTEED